MKQQGINKTTAVLPKSFGGWSTEQDFAWSPRNNKQYNKHICKSGRSANASSGDIAKPQLDVAYREIRK